MRIAMIGQKGIFVTHDGGIETHVENLSKTLAEMDHQVFVYSRKHYTPRKLMQKSGAKGLKLIFTPSINTKYLDAITHTLTSTIHALFQKYDVIHYHGVGPSVLSFIPRILKWRVKTVVTFHSQDRYHKKWGRFASKILQLGEWTACNFPDETIAVSKTIKRLCKMEYNKEVNYIPNGVKVWEVQGSDKLKKWGLEPDKYILSVARFIRHKGLHWLIKAYHKLDTDKKLVLVGESPYPSEYKDYLVNLAKGDDNIIFTGYQTGEHLDQLFTNAYMYVHPSEAEGLAITILEAMSYGRTVLISDIPENLEAMGDYGRYFKTGNVKDLYQKMKELVADSEYVKITGEKAKNFVGEEYAWDKITTEILQLYKK